MQQLLRERFDARFPPRQGGQPRIVSIEFGSIIVTIESSARFAAAARRSFDGGDHTWLEAYTLKARPVCVGVGLRLPRGAETPVPTTNERTDVPAARAMVGARSWASRTTWAPVATGHQVVIDGGRWQTVLRHAAADPAADGADRA